MKKVNLEGQRFGKLLVIKRYCVDKTNNVKWLCRCDCGNEKIVYGISLRNGGTRSCGCLQKQIAKKSAKKLAKHNKYKTRIYRIWGNIVDRTENPNATGYKYYGGRGIKVCPEWRNNFMNFYDWSMGNGYSDNLTIDRINCNGNYEPQNCRWASMQEQQNNKTNNKIILFNNKKYTMAQLAREYKINYNTLANRLSKGWTIEKAITTKIRK